MANLANFDPTKLVMPTSVNPRISKVTAWDIRVTSKTSRVDVTGLMSKMGLTEKGLNFSYDPTNNALIIWAVEKDAAMTVKGEATEYKMASFVDLAKKVGLVKENHKITYLTVEPIEGHPNFYLVVEDSTNAPVIQKTDDVSDSEIEDILEPETVVVEEEEVEA